MDFLCFAYLCLRTEHGNSFCFAFDLEKVDVAISQSPFARSESTMEVPEQCGKSIQSQQ